LTVQIYHAPADQTSVRQVGLLHAVFDRGSGRTHLITDVAHALMEAARQPGSREALCERVRAVADIEPVEGSDINQILLARVDELVELELLKLVY
jgi:PqqD family protein of HPr-rel-A system